MVPAGTIVGLMAGLSTLAFVEHAKGSRLDRKGWTGIVLSEFLILFCIAWCNAGGSNLCIRHGQYRKFSDDVPLSNLFVKMLQKMDVPVDTFKDSTGPMNEILT